MTFPPSPPVSISIRGNNNNIVFNSPPQRPISIVPTENTLRTRDASNTTVSSLTEVSNLSEYLYTSNLSGAESLGELWSTVKEYRMLQRCYSLGIVEDFKEELDAFLSSTNFSNIFKGHIVNTDFLKNQFPGYDCLDPITMSDDDDKLFVHSPKSTKIFAYNLDTIKEITLHAAMSEKDVALDPFTREPITAEEAFLTMEEVAKLTFECENKFRLNH